MKRVLLVVSSAIAIAGCSSPRCESPNAQSLVTALRPEKQFETMLKMHVERTQTYSMAMAKDGAGTKVKLDAALERAVEKHGAEWERNLVESWATLDSVKLAQACDALAKRDEARFTTFASKVGGDVKSKNQPLLERAAIEILDQIWT